MNVLSGELDNLPSNRGEADKWAEAVVGDIRNGKLSALDLKTFLEWFNYAQKAVFDNVFVKDIMVAEAAVTPSKPLNGCIVTIETEFDYSVCLDHDWERWDSSFKRARHNRNQREKWLQSFNEPDQIQLTEDGEYSTIYPPKRTKTVKIIPQ